MNNRDVAGSLDEIAELLELKGESTFRIRAYQNAGRAVENFPEDVNAVALRGDLTHIPGVGKGLAEKIHELLTTGRMRYLEELRSDFPGDVRSLLQVPGVGPTLARRAFRELHVTNLDDLRTAAEDGRLAGLSGMGQKTAENVLRGLGRVNKRVARIPLDVAWTQVEEIMGQLVPGELFDDLTPAGSLRRWAPTIGDVDLIATTTRVSEAMQAFAGLPQVKDVLGTGQTKTSIVTDNGLAVDLRLVQAEEFGSLLQHFTGSKDHNIQLRDFALRQGLSLSEYGITSIETSKRENFRDEVAFYQRLGLEWVSPELREGLGEIEAAQQGLLPDLVEVSDIKGDLHAHTDWSDGSVSIEAMVAAAKERGYQYIAITDHSGGIGVAHGLTPERLLEQIARVEQLRKEIRGIRIMTGTELEIKRDGTLDFPDEVLAKLDWVIASVHSGFNQTEQQMTARIVRAMENPHVDAIGHPTGALIGRREPYAVDLETVFQAAARTETALEINAQPSRLDLVDVHARRAKDLGVTLVIDTDSHAPGQLSHMRYGVEMARRAWAEASDVLNTRTADELRVYLKRVAP
ncbi:MAG: DNA polymerase/3'-5' exonuclease PolX [Chloroflexota bacterium]